jgi:hypothetical protein
MTVLLIWLVAGVSGRRSVTECRWPAITKPRPGVYSGPSSALPARGVPAGIGLVVLAGAAVLLVRRRRGPR